MDPSARESAEILKYVLRLKQAGDDPTGLNAIERMLCEMWALEIIDRVARSQFRSSLSEAECRDVRDELLRLLRGRPISELMSVTSPGAYIATWLQNARRSLKQLNTSPHRSASAINLAPLDAFISDLEPVDNEIFFAYFRDCLSIKEISIELTFPYHLVAGRLFRIVHDLGDLLNRQIV